MAGLAYAIAATELVLAPFIPSNTARGGGIIAPIVEGLAKTLGSTPHETPRRGGAYLVQVGAHSNLVTSAMFLTAMAGNANVPPAAKTELGVDFGVTTWLQGSIVPGLVSLGLVPLVVWLLERPVKVEIASVRGKVREDLAALGKWKREELRLVFLLAGLLILWSTQRLWSTPKRTDATATVALFGVVLLVLGGIRSWRELASSWRAWDALVWLGGFVALAEALKMSGFTGWFAANMRALFSGWEPITTALVLALIYFASMYLFSQLTAHIAALAAVFFAVAASSGCPPLLTVALIAYFGCLCGATTPWSTGPVIIYFAQGYVSVLRWMRNGLFMALFQIAVWLAVGMLWWRALGWW
jgi:DASS family divalent anion:Na+ symporter